MLLHCTTVKFLVWVLNRAIYMYVYEHVYVCACVCMCVYTSTSEYTKSTQKHLQRGYTAPVALLTHSYLSTILPPSLFSIAPFIPVLIPLSNPSLSFHLRSNNISNSYSHPAIPPMAISATALEIFNTLYPQFG